MGASPTPSPGRPQADADEEAGSRQPQPPRLPQGAFVVIKVPGGLAPAPPPPAASAASPPAGAAHGADDDDTGGREDDTEQQPRGAAFSLWRAAGAVLALAALAAAGYACLYAAGDAGAAWRLLAARRGDDEGQGPRTSFLLPLFPKPRARGGGGAWKGASADDHGPRNSTSAVLPLDGAAIPHGLYYTTISIGNPPRPYFLDVDTGSDITWVQCDAPCTSCGKGAHPLYNRPTRANLVPAGDPLCEHPQESPDQCDYDISYADGSSSLGVYVRDNMQLLTADGERENVDAVFGCGYDQRGNLLTALENTDGILGLSSREISLPTQLASRGIISNVFGHCMMADPSAGGYLFLGDDYIPRWGMTWVPVRNGPAESVRRARVQQVNHGDQQLNAQGKLTQVIFDSGSTYTYFPHAAYINLIAELKAASPRFVQDDSDKTLPFCMKPDFPVRTVGDVKHLFKPLSLQFGKRWFLSRTFNLQPEDYLIISDKGNVCLGVLDGTAIGFDSEIILGDVSLRGKLVAYDSDENQIGWADSDCLSPRKQSRIPSFLRRALRSQLL